MRQLTDGVGWRTRTGAPWGMYRSGCSLSSETNRATNKPPTMVTSAAPAVVIVDRNGPGSTASTDIVSGHVIPHDLHDQRHVIPHRRSHVSPWGRRSRTGRRFVHWYAGHSKSRLAASLEVDRKTIRKYLAPGGGSRDHAGWTADE